MTEPEDILRKNVETFQKKNEDYSDTWIVTGIALSMLHDEPVELESDIDHIVNGNVHRLLDKVLRGYNAAVINDDEDMNYEAAVDSFEDASNYSAMIASSISDPPTVKIQQAYSNAYGGRATSKNTDTKDGKRLETGNTSNNE